MNNTHLLKLAYLRHLKRAENELDVKVRSLPACADWTAQIGKMPKEQAYAAIKCDAENYQTVMNLLTRAIEIHHQRLSLEVRWGIADSKSDADELGWNHPRATWNGTTWVCPTLTHPQVVKAEQDAGADEYIHCLP
jgi:hypothetical protein